MTFGEKVRLVREKLFLSQAALGKELGVSFSSVNRWELNKTLPNWKAKKAFHDFCEKNEIEFEDQ